MFLNHLPCLKWVNVVIKILSFCRSIKYELLMYTPINKKDVQEHVKNYSFHCSHCYAIISMSTTFFVILFSISDSYMKGNVVFRYGVDDGSTTIFDDPICTNIAQIYSADIVWKTSTTRIQTWLRSSVITTRLANVPDKPSEAHRVYVFRIPSSKDSILSISHSGSWSGIPLEWSPHECPFHSQYL